MGDRAQVLFFEEVDYKEDAFSKRPSLYLYTHWGGTRIKETLANALLRGEGRWSDPSYLTRIIISEFVKDDVLGDTGYGISINELDSEHDDPSIYLSFHDDNRKIVYKDQDYTYQEWVTDWADEISPYTEVGHGNTTIRIA